MNIKMQIVAEEKRRKNLNTRVFFTTNTSTCLLQRNVTNFAANPHKDYIYTYRAAIRILGFCEEIKLMCIY